MSAEKLKKVYLIDTMSHIFRAFFAPMGMRQEPLRNSKGQVTQAVFVFTNMLRKLLNDEKPDYIAAIFDTPEKTFRHDSFADYKANRAEMPDDLATQLPYIVRVCEAFNVPILKLPGFEADDLIGTLAKKCAAQNMQAVIVSNDKDLCQLVQDPHIVCMRQNSQNIKRKVPVPPIELCDEAWVLNKFGVPPNKIIDLLGLMGDAIDNIPGAPGIGEKGALKIITEYGSIENAIANADKITHKTYRESLQNNQAIIRQSLELATIHCEVPVELDLDLLKHREPNRPLAYQLFRELEFNTLTKEFTDSDYSLFPLFADMPQTEQVTKSYSLIKTREDLDKLVRKLWESEHWSFAVDDNEKLGSFDKQKPLGVAIASNAGSSFYVDLSNEELIPPLKDTIENGFLTKCVYDLKRNLATLQKIGIMPEAVEDDVMLAAYLIDPSRSEYDIATLAQQQIGVDSNFEIPEGFTDSQWRTLERADFTFQLAPFFRNKLRELNLEKVYTEIELPIVPLLFEMEMVGMKIDADVLHKLSADFTVELAKLSTRIFELAGEEFKINSPKQVGEMLAKLNMETGKKTAKGQISTSKEVLGELALTYEMPKLILEFRELEKLKSTYTDTLPEKIASDGRIHGKLNQTVAATGRLSSTEPNLQNIPIRTELGQKIRSAFIPEEGNVLLSADYSQLELRILAHVTQDEVLLDAFKKGEDIHARTAKLVFGDESQRRLAKIVNFGIAYAVEAYGLSQRIGLSVSESKKIITDYYETYKGVKKYMEETPEFARKNGYVASIFGRRRPLPSILDKNFNVRSRAEREAINMPIQGCLPFETKVLTSKGYQAIGELYLEDTKDLQVWTGTKFANFEVLNRGECELAELDLANGQTLRCDTRHEVLTVTDDGYKWKKFKELEENDKICLSMPRELEYGENPKLNYKYIPKVSTGIPINIKKLDDEFFYWLGFYYGDGWINHRAEEGRWNLQYSFGDVKDKALISQRMDACTTFFKTLNLRTSIHWQSENKAALTIYSKGFIEFLSEIGIDTKANAKSKRVPKIVFESTLESRKSFLKGFLDSDGFEGKNGATSSIHLCQKEILEDLMLLFRTVGVESRLRGPYYYQEFTSYRLNLVGGMLRKSLNYFSEYKSIRIPNMNAPKFLVDEFVEKIKPENLKKHSHKVIYSRLLHGGVTSVYVLDEMIKDSGKELKSPIYSWSILKEKRSLGEIENTYTLSVDDELHRFDSEGVISKNTASDIVKIAMLKVDKALIKEGLEARMIMQIHDELLLEVPKNEIEEVSALVKREMENAVELDVPVIAEVGVGANWMTTK